MGKLAKEIKIANLVFSSLNTFRCLKTAKSELKIKDISLRKQKIIAKELPN